MIYLNTVWGSYWYWYSTMFFFQCIEINVLLLIWTKWINVFLMYLFILMYWYVFVCLFECISNEIYIYIYFWNRNNVDTKKREKTDEVMICVSGRCSNLYHQYHYFTMINIKESYTTWIPVCHTHFSSVKLFHQKRKQKTVERASILNMSHKEGKNLICFRVVTSVTGTWIHGME